MSHACPQPLRSIAADGNHRAGYIVQEARLRVWRPPVEPIDQAMTPTDVRAALVQLTPDHRQVIVEMFYRGRSVTEIAQLLSIPEGTVTSRSYHGLRQLRRLLSPSDA